MSEILDQIRAKFPQYESLSDDDLTLKIGEKFPVYLQHDKDFNADFTRVKQSQKDALATGARAYISQRFSDQPTQTADSLSPLLPQPSPQLPAPEVPELRQQQPQPRTLETLLRGTGEPLPVPPGVVPRLERPENISPAEVLQVPTQFPFPRLSKQEAELVVPKPLAGPVAGTQQAVADFADFLSSPAGFASALAPETFAGTAAEKLVGKTMATAFAADMAKNMPDQFESIYRSLKAGDSAEATRQLLNAGAGALMIGGAIRANIKGKGKFNAPQERTQPEGSQQQYPGTEAQRLPTERGSGDRAQPIPQQQRTANLQAQKLTPQDFNEAERLAGEEAKKLGSPIRFVDRFEGEGEGVTMANTVARAMGDAIEIHRGEFQKSIQNVPPAQRARYIQSLVAEEHIHRNVTDADAGQYWNTLTGPEKAIEIRQYGGEGIWTRKSLNQYLERELSDSQLGHEAMRRRLQKLIGSSPTEIAASALRERWTIQTIDALGTAIRKTREAFGTSASAQGIELMNRAEQNLAVARGAVSGQPPAQKDVSADDLLKMSPDEVVAWKKAVKYGPEVSKSIAEGLTREQVQKLKDESQKLRDKSYALGTTGKEADFNQAQVLSLKSQTLREIAEDWDADNEPFSIRRRKGQDDRTEKLPLLPGATPEDRATAEQMGAATKITPQDVDRGAAEHMQSETDRILGEYEKNPTKSIKPPTFDKFSEAMQRKFEGVKPGQLYEAYSKALYNRLFNSSGRALEALQKSLGIEVKGSIPDPAARGQTLLQIEGATPEARAQLRDESKGAQSRQKYRMGAISLIARKLLSEAQPEKPTLTKVSPEDIRYSSAGKEAPFFDISRDDLDNPKVLEQRLTADSRRSNRDPVSLTKRVTALLDKQTGKVYLVSTYPHGRSGAMLLDPSVSQIRAHKPLSQLLARYRPISSMLLDEPVRGFRQSFASLGDYESKLATDVRRGIQSVGEAPLAEGEASVPGSFEVGGPITDAEAGAILDHVTTEVGVFDSPDDVKASLESLKDRPNFQVISGYRKLAAEIQRRNPDLSDIGVINQLAQNIYENHIAAGQSASGETPFEAFRRRTLSQGGAGDRPNVAPAREPGPSETSRELTMPIERRPPTDVRPENIPAEEAAKLGTKPAPPVPEGTLEPARSPAAIRRRGSIEDDIRAVGEGLRYLGARSEINDQMARMVDDMTNRPNNQAREVESGIRLKSIAKKPTVGQRVFTQWQQGNKKILAAAKTLVYSGALRSTGTIDVGHAQSSIAQFHGLVDAGIADAKQMIASGSLLERRRGRIKLRAANQLKEELTFAENNLTNQQLINTAHRSRQELNRLYIALKRAGQTVNFKENYLPGRYDIEGTDGRTLFMQEPRIIGTKFREPKVFNNYYEAIAVPGEVYVPATFDAASLVGNAVRRGMQLIQKAQTEDLLKGMTAPDGHPLAVDAESRGGPGAQIVPPRGYAGYEVVGGIAVHPHFASAWRALTGRSFIEDTPVLRQALHFTQGLKHALLLGDFFHLGRISYYASALMREKAGFKGGWSALDFQDRDLNDAVRKGLISQRQADWGRTLIDFGGQQITRRQLLEKAQTGGVGFNVGRIQDALYKDVFTQLTPTAGPLKRMFAKITDPTTGRYNRFLFDKYTRGLMAESLVTEFERQSKALSKNVKLVQGQRVAPYDPMVLLKDISRDMNNFYGNIGRQGWMKSKSTQDLARLFWLAPQWVEGLVKKEAVGATRITAGTLAEVGKRVGLETPYRRGKASWGATGLGMASGIAFMFGLAQAFNIISRGKPTFMNEEKDHKWDAFVPIGPDGYWFNPLSTFAEITHDLWRLSQTKPKVMDAVDQIAGNKESPLMRGILIARTGIGPRGQRFTSSAAQLKEAGKAMLPIPITFGKGAQALGHTIAPSIIPPTQPGSVQAQAFQSLGLKLQKGETSYQRISEVARDFMQKNGYTKETGWQQIQTDEPGYTKLRQQIRDGDNTAALATFKALTSNRSTDDVVKAMKIWSNHPLTGSKQRESEFIKGLTDKELDLYTKGEEERFQTYNAFLDFLIKNNL